MDALSDLHQRLRVIAGLLDGAASQVRDAALAPTKTHIGRIGEALAAIYDIQSAIHKLRPELDIPYEEPPEEVRAANKRIGEVLIAAYDLADDSKISEAVALLTEYAQVEPSEYHRSLVNGEVDRLKANYET